MRYFESRTPTIRVFAGGSEVVEWLTADGGVGYHATDSSNALRALDRCIKAGIGGVIREIAQPEYEDAVKKVEGRPVWRRDRETIGAGELPPTARPSAGAPAAAPVAEVASPTSAPIPPEPVSAAVPVQNPPPPLLRKRGRPPKLRLGSPALASA